MMARKNVDGRDKPGHDWLTASSVKQPSSAQFYDPGASVFPFVPPGKSPGERSAERRHV